MFGIGHWELLVIILVLVLLFGSAKIPSLMKSLGSGVTEFKKGVREGEREAEQEIRAEKKKEEGEGAGTAAPADRP